MTSLLSLIPRDDRVGPYNYIPTTYVCIIFLSPFAISTLLHTVQMIYFRLWWPLPTLILAGTLEILGWSARLWSSYSPALLSPFEMQITATIIAPPCPYSLYHRFSRLDNDSTPLSSTIPP